MSNSTGISNGETSRPSTSKTDLQSLASSLDASASISDFINHALSSSPSDLDLTTLDRSVSDLLAQLSILTQDTSGQLERSIHEISRTVPRLTYDLQYMRESAEGVRRSLEGVETTIKGKDSSHLVNPQAAREQDSTNSILDRLTHLDKLKSNLSDARSVLREAESWSTLESETLTSLSQGRYRQAANRLAEASESIHMFQRSPKEYDLRKTLLVSLQNQLEAELDGVLASMASGVPVSRRPSQAHNEKQEEEGEKEKMTLPELLKIFGLIEREGEYRSIYFNARRKGVLDAWNNVDLVESQGQGSEGRSADITTLNEWLPTFYETFLKTIQTESDSMKTIFHDPVPSLVAFFQTTFEALEPSFSQRLALGVEYHSKQGGDGELNLLLGVWKSTTAFGKQIQAILDKLFFETQPAVLSASPGQQQNTSPGIITGTKSGRSRSGSVSTLNEPSKRSTRRFSRSFGNGGISATSLSNALAKPDLEAVPTGMGTVESITGQWDAVLYEPFLQYQNDYMNLEKRYMLNLLRTEGVFVEPASLAGRTPGERLLTKGLRLMKIAEDGLERCMTFTLGFGLADLLEAFGYAMESFIGDNKGLLELKGGVGAVQTESERKRKTAGGRDSFDEFDDLEGLDGVAMDSTSDELATFKLGLGVLRSCARLKTCVDEYSVKVDQAIGITSNGLNALAQSIALPADTPLAGVTKGAPALLKQSGLNQLAFVRLVDGQSSIDGLRPAQKAVYEYAKDAQTATQKAILKPILAQLEGYPGLSAWAQSDKVARRGELHVPTFSLSPTDIISAVTEGLLDLLRLFEGFATDGGLAFSLGTLPFVDVEMLSTMAQAAQDEVNSRPQHHRTISNVGSFASMNDKLNLNKPNTSPSTMEPVFPSEAVLSTWVSSTTSALLDQFTAKILPEITKPLTKHGASQLATDLSYLSNAMRAMDVESQHLECWRESCEAKDVSELKEIMRQEKFISRCSEAVDIARYVGWLRGWNMDQL